MDKTIKQIEEAINGLYSSDMNKQLNSQSKLRSNHIGWIRHQQDVIKRQAEEIADLKQQLEDYEHAHNAEMEGMDEVE